MTLFLLLFVSWSSEQSFLNLSPGLNSQAPQRVHAVRTQPIILQNSNTSCFIGKPWKRVHARSLAEMFKKPCLGRGIKGKFFYGSHRHALFRKCSEVCWAPLITFSMDGTLSASTYMGLMPLYPSPVINDHNETNTQPGQSAPLYPCPREGCSLNTAPTKGLPRVEREGVGVACKDRADNYKLPTHLSVSHQPLAFYSGAWYSLHLKSEYTG